MSQFMFKKAERTQRKARIALAGPSGSGKTYTALRLAKGLAGDGTIALLDTERSSATLYSDVCNFDHVDLPDYDYETFIGGIDAAAAAGYSVLVIDSASHAWEAFLEQHGKMQGNSFANWGKITPKYNQLIQAIVSYPGHVIATMRSKTKYELDEKGKPKRQYLDSVMRPGSEYEFDILGMIDIDHNMLIEKTRLSWLADKIISKPSEKLGAKIAEWLANAKPVEVAPEKKPVDTIKPSESPSNWIIQTEKSQYAGKSLEECFFDDHETLIKIIRSKRFTAYEEADRVNMEAFNQQLLNIKTSFDDDELPHTNGNGMPHDEVQDDTQADLAGDR
jgi:hypothetical protein